jgi:putative aldouronate transport system permease protein
MSQAELAEQVELSEDLIGFIENARKHPSLDAFVRITYFIIFKYLPMGYLSMAFFDYKLLLGFAGSKFVGLKHFQAFISGMNFTRTIWNTLALNLLSIAFVFPSAILLALMLNEVVNTKVKRTLQTITYMPYFISTVVFIGMINSFLSPSLGLLGVAFRAFGLTPPYLLGDPGMFRGINIVSGIWQTAGWNSVVYLSAITAIDPSLYEAAKVDGAGRFRRICHVTIPGIKQTIIILLILRVGELLGANFEKVLLLQNDLNLSVSELLPTYIYKVGMVQGKYSFSAAVGLFNAVVSLMLVLIANFASKKLSSDTKTIF